MILFAAILFIFSFLVLTSMFLVKLAQILQRPFVKIRINSATQTNHETLWPYFRLKLGIFVHQLWHFILEAKDLKPATTKTIHHQMEKVKNVFRIRIRTSELEPHWLPEAAELTIKPNANQSPEDLYLDAIKKNPGDKEAYEALGRLYLQNKNYHDAIETYEYLIKLDPTKDIYLSNLALAHYSVGDYSKACINYERAIAINNKIPTRWINLALCFDAVDDSLKAVKAINSALQLDKLNISYMMLLADAYIKIVNKIRAEEVLEQILSIDPTNKSAREKLMKLRI